MLRGTCGCSGTRGLGGFGAGASIEPGTAEVEDIVCPAGYQVGADAQGNVWCDNGSGGHVPPVYKPSTHLASQPLGVMGWSILIAGGLVAGYFLLKK
jgi:hypothetical protein